MSIIHHNRSVILQVLLIAWVLGSSSIVLGQSPELHPPAADSSKEPLPPVPANAKTFTSNTPAMEMQQRLQGEDEKEPKQIDISQLDPSFDGTDVVMTFKVTKCYRISGGVPKGRVPTFGIEAVTAESDPRFSVRVGGELADAMGRFGFGPTRGEDSLTGIVIEARGIIQMYPAPKDATEKGPSYSFIIEDWKGFRFKPTSERP